MTIEELKTRKNEIENEVSRLEVALRKLETVTSVITSEYICNYQKLCNKIGEIVRNTEGYEYALTSRIHEITAAIDNQYISKLEDNSNNILKELNSK